MPNSQPVGCKFDMLDVEDYDRKVLFEQSGQRETSNCKITWQNLFLLGETTGPLSVLLSLPPYAFGPFESLCLLMLNQFDGFIFK